MANLQVVTAEPWPAAFDRVGEFWFAIQHVALNALLAAVMTLTGWLLARLLSGLVRRVLGIIRFDETAGRLTGGTTIARHLPTTIAAWAVHWLVIAMTLVLTLEAIGLPIATLAAQRLIEVLPRIATSAVLLILGSMIALLIGSVTSRFLHTVEYRGARLFGQMVTGLLFGFSALLALEQLGFAAQFVMAVGIVAVAAVGLGFALAFGLGCRELVRDFVIEYLKSLDDEKGTRAQ